MPSSLPPSRPSSEELLAALRVSAEPPVGVRERVKERVQQRISTPNLLEQARDAVVPPAGTSSVVWQQVLSRVTSTRSVGWLDRLRGYSVPMHNEQAVIWRHILVRLDSVPRVSLAQRGLRWVAVAAVMLLSVQVVMPFILAPTSIAQSVVLLRPTAGTSFYLRDGFWEPLTREISIQKSIVIRTDDGEVTIVLHDDGVIRVGPQSTVALHDLADRPHVPEYVPSVTLHRGKVWVLGLIPSPVPGIVVATSQGRIRVQEGSVSVTEDLAANVRVWDRKAFVENDSRDVPIIAGERADVQGGTLVSIGKISPALYDDAWVKKNLSADAVHRREIAQLQQERRAAMAGILPNSPFYAVKRAAERVDVLLTLSPEVRVQKQLAQANTRLNEAAALLKEGNDGAKEALREYTETVLSVASGSGDVVLKSLVEQQVAATAAEVSAALPTDVAYAIKETVLLTSAALPDSAVKQEDVQGAIVLDTYAAIRGKIEKGDLQEAKKEFEALVLDTSSLPFELQKEAEASYSFLQMTLDEGETDETASTVASFSPAEEGQPLSPKQVEAYADRIAQRIGVFDQRRPQYNQLVLEFHALENHPDRGRILRQLLHKVPEELHHFVQAEMQEVKDKVSENASGTGAVGQ